MLTSAGCGAILLILALVIAYGPGFGGAAPKTEYAGNVDALRPCASAAIHPC